VAETNADQLEAGHHVVGIDQSAKMLAMAQTEVSDELTDRAVYHYYPPLEKVREWIDRAGFVIEDDGAGSGFHHFLVKKKGVI
jgi:hypothetical protein